ncbi:MAG: response regulator, partial [Pseudomonadota bacterium]
MDERQAAIAAELAKLRESYLARISQEMAGLAELAAGLINLPEDTGQRLEDLNQHLHKLAGSGGTFGLHDLSRQARTLEETVRGWLAADFSAVNRAQRQELAAAVVALAATLDPHEAAPPNKVTGVPNAPVLLDANRRIQVWLVEDDVLLGETLRQRLESFGYEVRLFTRIDAIEAAARLASPDILVVDAMFPEEGANATLAFSERPVFQALTCPLLFMSAQGDFQSRVRAVRLGAEGFLLKPLDVPQLVNRIERTLEERFAVPYRVLIVDDDVDLSHHFRLVLSTAGMEVEVLNHPETVIDKVSAFHPELILMDLYMPGYSGQELAAVIRQHDEWIGLPIVYLSAETDRDKQLQAMKRGADDFLTKPISDAQLVAAVRVRTARSRQLADLMTKDSLTGLLKHARIKETLAVELARARRNGTLLSVAMIDIDYFKKVNDTYGHATGDRVIVALAHLLKQRLRKTDGIGRYGGEEFVAILP